MASKTQYTCDICGKVKGETNHWFLANTDYRVPIISIRAWSEAATPEWAHLCGESCAIKLLSNWMQDQKKGQHVEANS